MGRLRSGFGFGNIYLIDRGCWWVQLYCVMLPLVSVPILGEKGRIDGLSRWKQTWWWRMVVDIRVWWLLWGMVVDECLSILLWYVIAILIKTIWLWNYCVVVDNGSIESYRVWRLGQWLRIACYFIILFYWSFIFCYVVLLWSSVLLVNFPGMWCWCNTCANIYMITVC